MTDEGSQSNLFDTRINQVRSLTINTLYLHISSICIYSHQRLVFTPPSNKLSPKNKKNGSKEDTTTRAHDEGMK